ncbi:MAG: phage holin family protein [Oscillospiraceae bacterium]
MEFLKYIDPALLILIPALNLIGWAIKHIEKADNRHIPLMLMAAGVVLAILWVLASSDIATYKDVFTAIFTALVQGVLCAGVAVLGNQILKQEGQGDA